MKIGAEISEKEMKEIVVILIKLKASSFEKINYTKIF